MAEDTITHNPVPPQLQGKNFQPGQSGNPAGKKPGTLNRATIVRNILEAAAHDSLKSKLLDGVAADQIKTVADQLTLVMVSKAATGDLAAFQELMNSCYGKNSDKMEVTGKDGGAIKMETIDDVLGSLKPSTGLPNEKS